MRLGLIGYGVIAETLLATLAHELPAPLELLVCLAKPEGEARARSLLAKHTNIAQHVEVIDHAEALSRLGADIVVECASQAALGMYGTTILKDGIDLIVSSVGALADDALHTALVDAARKGGARLRLPAGAVGGIDMLSAARLAGLDEVVYVGRKPPLAWKGTSAEAIIDLDNLGTALAFYEGSARSAATEYPKNANVAAIIALAGIGFERTRVELIADPAIIRNVHEIRFRSKAGIAQIRIENEPSSQNPKTSLGTAYSIAQTVLNVVLPEVI
ncbi:aspartate dehydrogenase [Acidiphilium sp. AL]|uniref:L-aspartate dehydrogenase n=1 Tax=Acidiphilium iwatense TaxID=768198 RepID=A0ABS9DZK5_9PROT|nr:MULTISPECIES: aspartate dehydrogenase [Acidiphilium]MCF3948201.1 aspartate dehydrogenase [Acidiphilium iwatense]MCU4161682.1 aspartate dehydrogenase [Acidiphilium sp. AL]